VANPLFRTEFSSDVIVELDSPGVVGGGCRGLKLPILSVKRSWRTLVVNDLKRISRGIPAESTHGPCSERTEIAEFRVFFMGLSRLRQ